MSHPNPSHDRENEVPEDKVTHYPKKTIMGRAKEIGIKHKALKKAMYEVGGRFTKKHE